MSGDGDKKPYGNGDGKVSLKELKIHHLTNGDIEQLLSYSDFTLYFVEQFPWTFLCQFPVLRPKGFTEVFFPEICVKLPYLVSGADSLSNTL